MMSAPANALDENVEGRVDPESAELDDNDHLILSQVEHSLENGRQLRTWWVRTNEANSYEEKFETATTLNRPGTSFAFLDHAELNGKNVAVLGDMQEMFYDNVKMSAGDPDVAKGAVVEFTRKQLQEYILHYYSRTSSSARPKYHDPSAPTPPDFLNPFGLSPRKGTEREGFGQVQLYYKLLDGRIGKFQEKDRAAIVDLREIGSTYEWIVGDARMFGFQFPYMPLGPNLPYGELPLKETQLAVISSDFITNWTNPNATGAIRGQYGYGLATMKIPVNRTPVGYGPGFFDFGFMTYTWQIENTGTILAKMVFCVNQPDCVINPALNPITYGIRAVNAVTNGWAGAVLESLPRRVRAALTDPVFGSIAVANLATFDWASRKLNLSERGVMKLFLYYHYVVIYMLVANSVMTWRQIPDWFNDLPEWVIQGTGDVRELRTTRFASVLEVAETLAPPEHFKLTGRKNS
ncbi:MAG: hypothetical protein ABIZ80_19685 [Bryobacteraceae bacterium]